MLSRCARTSLPASTQMMAGDVSAAGTLPSAGEPAMRKANSLASVNASKLSGIRRGRGSFMVTDPFGKRARPYTRSHGSVRKIGTNRYLRHSEARAQRVVRATVLSKLFSGERISQQRQAF